MNTRSDRVEFAPRSVDNAVSVENLQQARIDREITAEIADATRKFNKVLGKISHDNAYEVFETFDFKHYTSYEIVLNAVNNAFEGQPEHYYRVDGIVAQLQIALAEYGYKINNW